MGEGLQNRRRQVSFGYLRLERENMLEPSSPSMGLLYGVCGPVLRAGMDP